MVAEWVRMNVEHLWVKSQGKNKVPGGNLIRCHFDNYKSHMDAQSVLLHPRITN